ncbi:MAG: hypothetical protein GY778_24205, partial [bacterium]|nr:hypothetical protein [bacterium]
VLFATTVNFNTKLKEDTSFGQPIVEFAPSSMGARDFQKLAREMISLEAPALPASDDMIKHVEQMAAEAERLLATTATLIGNGRGSTGSGDRPKDQTRQQSTTQPQPATRAPTTVAAASARPAPASHEEIAAKIEAIYGVRQGDDGIVFRSHLPEAKQVQIAGDFNDWMPHTLPMNRDDRTGGDYVAKLHLPTGRYRYRLVIDGRWSHDAANPHVETNEYGELNSIVEVR